MFANGGYEPGGFDVSIIFQRAVHRILMIVSQEDSFLEYFAAQVAYLAYDVIISRAEMRLYAVVIDPRVNLLPVLAAGIYVLHQVLFIDLYLDDERSIPKQPAGLPLQAVLFP